MRVLLLLSESWNDVEFPNNNMTNWFQNIKDVEIWTISGSAQLPNNDCCKEYFLIGEMNMLKSIYNKKRAGKRFTLEKNAKIFEKQKCEFTKKKKIKRLFSGELAYLARDIVWRVGKYNLDAMKKFIDECDPDIIFSQRRGSIKMCRLEQIVMGMTSAPMIAYTGDDEYSLYQFSMSPIFWMRRIWTRKWLRNTVKRYSLLYSQSERQMKEYEKDTRVKTKFLVKCGSFDQSKIHTFIGKPIQIVYAGKLYCNRWKTLRMLTKAIEKINEENHKLIFCLNIYTADIISKKMNDALNDGINSIIHGAVSAQEVINIYSKSDIVLHVESFDLHNRLLTQDSFSTKVIDCLASGAAVMAICWEKHAAFQYLKRQNAAITASSIEEIYMNLLNISKNPAIIREYAQRAYDCGIKNHQRSIIQEQLKGDMRRVMRE